MGMTGKDRFRNFAVKRLEFAGFTSCENFRCYCGPILRGVRGMEKKIWSSINFWFIFPPVSSSFSIFLL